MAMTIILVCLFSGVRFLLSYALNGSLGRGSNIIEVD